MTISRSERWFRLLLRLYPVDFREEMGEALVEAYRDRCRKAAARGGAAALTGIWYRALVDSLRNGLGERARPGITWRRTGDWGRDAELAMRQQRVSAVLIGGFSVGALLLAVTGLFGVVAGSVARRRHEIAVRLALGAEHRQVVRLLVREGAALVVLGVVIGAPGIYLAGRALRSMLVGISPFDPTTLGAVAAGLAVAGVVSCYLPARRVGRIDPARAFRDG